MRAVVVHSQDVDSVDAVAELIAGAKVELGESVPRVAMLFAGIDHDFAIVLEQINAQWPGIALIGCTTDGEMSAHILFAEDSLALVLLSGDNFPRYPVWPGLCRPTWRVLLAAVLAKLLSVWPEAAAMAERRASASPCPTA